MPTMLPPSARCVCAPRHALSIASHRIASRCAAVMRIAARAPRDRAHQAEAREGRVARHDGRRVQLAAELLRSSVSEASEGTGRRAARGRHQRRRQHRRRRSAAPAQRRRRARASAQRVSVRAQRVRRRRIASLRCARSHRRRLVVDGLRVAPHHAPIRVPVEVRQRPVAGEAACGAAQRVSARGAITNEETVRAICARTRRR